MSNISCIDLFCGAGGLTHGLLQSGISVIAGIDLDPLCKHAYETNNNATFINKDITNISGEDINKLYGNTSIRVLAGCAPCQPFSTYSNRYDTIGTSQWGLLNEFSRIVGEAKPEVVTMENVPQVAKHTVYIDFVNKLKTIGYNCWEKDIDCSEYGLPQSRRRRVMIAYVNNEIQIESPDYSFSTVNDAIGNLNPIEAGKTDPNDRLHTAAKLSEINLKRIRHSKAGGTWRDWPEELRANCHIKDSGKTYSSVYGRMRGDRPSPTITTQFFGYGNGRFGHPDQDRAISLREGAILQGFPKSYSFIKDDNPLHIQPIGRMIGNAVPVKLGLIIGKSILKNI